MKRPTANRTADQPIRRDNMDPGIRPCDDFYEYANDAWLKNTQIPSDEAVWGGFSELRDRNFAVLQEILASSAAANGAPGSPTQLIGHLYPSGMDPAAIERAGLGAAKALLDEAGCVTTEQLPALFAKLTRLTVRAPFWPNVQPDAFHIPRAIVHLYHAGLGLPCR